MFLKQIITVICLLVITVSISAEVPNTINYQGRLTDATGTPVADGPHLVKFMIYNSATGGFVLLNTGFQTVTTVDGLFSYLLGSNVTLHPIALVDTNVYLGITVGADPEITPRTRLVSTPFAYHSFSTVEAINSGALGGLPPSFFRNWLNLLNVPAGFADGTDDEGLSQTTADATYVNLAGDVMTGNLDITNAGNPRVQLIGTSSWGSLRLFGSTSAIMYVNLFAIDRGGLLLTDGNNIQTVVLDANSTNNGGFLNLIDPNGSEDIYLSAEGSGNTSVILPDNAIDNTEILDEPGIASSISSSGTNFTTLMGDIITVTISIPNAGYIFLTSSMYYYHHSSTAGNYAGVQIDENVGGSWISPYTSFFGGAWHSASDTYEHVGAQRTYFKSAGTYTFRLEGMASNTNGTIGIGQPTITAMYFPTSYGTVQTVNSQPPVDVEATLVQSTNPDSSTISGYKYDLRNLELKAKASALKAKQDELKLLKAQQKQNRQE